MHCPKEVLPGAISETSNRCDLIGPNGKESISVAAALPPPQKLILLQIRRWGRNRVSNVLYYRRTGLAAKTASSRARRSGSAIGRGRAPSSNSAVRKSTPSSRPS